MAEDLGDLRQRHPGVGHLASQACGGAGGPDDRHSRPQHRRSARMPETPFVPSGPIGATARRNTSTMHDVFGRPLRR